MPAWRPVPRRRGRPLFDLTETADREWVKQAERDTGTRSDGGLASTERQELAQLRRENRRLREDVEILSCSLTCPAETWAFRVPSAA